MRAIHVPAHGPGDVMEIVDREVPEPGPGEVRVRTESIGVNFADIKRRRGDVKRLQETPYVPGIEAAGTIEAIGDSVGLAVGDRVAAKTNEGSYAEAFLADPDSLFSIPDEVSFDVAAGFPVQYLTAHNSLHGWGGFEAGEKVLVHAAAGGVGSAAVQLASVAGADVFATASMDEKLAYAGELGANHLIKYTDTDFVTEIDSITDGSGVDLVLDGVGGKTFDDSVDVLAPFGRIVSIGSASGSDGQVNPSPLRKRNLSVIGYHLGTAINARPERVRSAVQELFELFASGDVEVAIGEISPLEDAAEAHAFVENRQSRGKVLLHP